MYIYRELLSNLKHRMTHDRPFGFIVSGIVGCGKTTLVEKLISEMTTEYEIFRFTGDDIQFRKNVANDSYFILNHVRSTTNKKSIVFVDEVQKCEEIFDAIKIAFDSKKISFIVSGSNPAYLTTIAKKRLQRRAEQIFMLPLALSEILVAENIISESYQQYFSKSLLDLSEFSNLELPQVSLTEEITNKISQFLIFGGLPLAYLSKTKDQKFIQTRMSVERGFELLSTQNNAVSETIKIELADLSAKEFTYQNILQKTRLRKRDEINLVIDDLINHGYLVKKKPLLLSQNKSSYLTIFSYIDPGILTYLNGGNPQQEQLGFWLESYIHARLDSIYKNHYLKSELGYYKPHILDINGKVKYTPGEIDFISIQNKKILPIEVKLTNKISLIDTTQILKFLTDHKQIKFGIILYGGAPYFDKKNKILYWPFWMV